MKIAWFTPFSIRSAIGNYSKIACEALGEKNHVEIFTACEKPHHQTSIKVNQFTDAAAAGKKLDTFDYVFYNIGDSSAYHANIFDVAQLHPGIIVLHDLSLLNFLNGYYSVYKRDYAGISCCLHTLYGEKTAQHITRAASSAEDWDAIDFLCYNCIQWVTRWAKGIIVHSQYHKKILSEYYHGPCEAINFPYLSKQKGKKSQKSSSDKIQIVTIGHVNPNKRIGKVITAIGKTPALKQKLHYIVAGKLDGGAYEKTLHSLVEEFGLEDAVTLKGYVSDDELEDIYQVADVIVNLRKPAIEGASWSLVEQMDHAKPVIVMDNGFYQEMPDTCVYKIHGDDEEEIEAIQKALLALTNDQESRKNMGENAEKYVAEHFNPKWYTQAVEEFCKKIAFLKPLYELTDRVSDEMSVFGMGAGMKAGKNIAHEMDVLFRQ